MDNQDSKAQESAKSYFDSYLEGFVAHTAAGAAYPYHWGANRHVGNLGFLTMVHAKNGAVEPAYGNRLRNYGIHEANYLLGDAGRSWVVGFGDDYPKMHNHKMSLYSIQNWHPDPTQEPLGERIWMTDVAGPFAPENPTGYVQKAKFDFEGSRTPQAHIAWGTVFGSPLFDDSLINTRRDYTYAESTVEYNAGAVGAIAAMADWYKSGEYTGVESLEGVIPFTCDQPQTPWSTPLAAAIEPELAPAPEPALVAAPEPVLTPAPEPVLAPASEPVLAPVPGPVLAPALEPVLVPAPEPESALASEALPVVLPTGDAVAEETDASSGALQAAAPFATTAAILFALFLA